MVEANEYIIMALSINRNYFGEDHIKYAKTLEKLSDLKLV
jgi:hypothetical protein